jgi:hypothetical protein
MGQAFIRSLQAHLRRTALFPRRKQKNSVRLPPACFRLQDRKRKMATEAGFADRGESGCSLV